MYMLADDDKEIACLQESVIESENRPAAAENDEVAARARILYEMFLGSDAAARNYMGGSRLISV